MRKQQERAILANQVLIMEALALITDRIPTGGGYMADQLKLRVRDVKAYMEGN